MADQLSQERFNAISPVSNQYDDLIPETDSSDVDDSQPFAGGLSSANEVLVSETSCESDEDSGSDAIRPNENDDIVAETEPSESSDSQPNQSQPEFVATNEITIPATPSESDEEEDVLYHVSSFENDSLGFVPNTPAQRSLPTSLINSQMNFSPMHNANTDANHISETDDSQRSQNQFLIDTEINIPETPSQSESEQDEANNSQILDNSQHSNQSVAAAFSVGMSQLEDNVVSVVVNTIDFNDGSRRETMSPDIFDDSDDIIPNNLNIAESNAGASLAIISPVIDEPHQNETDPDDVHNDFPFIVPGKMKNSYGRSQLKPQNYISSSIRCSA